MLFDTLSQAPANKRYRYLGKTIMITQLKTYPSIVVDKSGLAVWEVFG